MAGEEPPAVPPRNSTVVPMEEPAAHVREFFEESLQRVHKSLERRIIACHTAVERGTCSIGPYIHMDSSQTSSNSEALVTALWSLLEPTADRTLQEFREDPAGEIERRLSALQEQLQTFSVDKKKAEDEVGNYKARLATSHKEATEAKKANQRLLEHNSKYREIILRGSSDEGEIPDKKIHGLFVELRVLIQRIVHCHYAVQGHKKLTIHNNPWFDRQKRFRDDLKGPMSEPMQKFWMRGRIFEMINRDLISSRSFGVSQFERHLRDFEKSLEGSKALSHSALAEWRSRTIECGASLRENSKRPGETCQDVLDFMEPFLSATTDASLELLEKLMRDLCEKAYSLSLLLRRSKKATFQIWTAKVDSIVTGPIEANVSCQEFDGPATAEILGSRVVMTIFGGLVKIPDETVSGHIVLERSEVVCRA